MYCISEQQIDFILDDLRARGIEMVSLQQNLLDHVCCIIEQNLEEDGNFESFYYRAIEQFYKKELCEIEEETINLLIHKNYYTMKKGMLISGILSTLFLSVGIALKFLHMPGAAALILLGVFLLSFLFLPLLFILKVKESKKGKDKVILGLGFLAAVSLTLGVLFKIMHWPYANMLGLASLFIMLFIFLPIYFLSGIKNPESKVNTIVSSLIIILACALMLMLVRSPNGTRKLYLQKTQLHFTNEQILKQELSIFQKSKLTMSSVEMNLFETCEQLKKKLLLEATGVPTIESAFEEKNSLINEANASDCLKKEDYDLLSKKINEYNFSLDQEMKKFIRIQLITEAKDIKSDFVLNTLFQIQMLVLQNKQ
jgi:hypothetical protein